MKANGRKRLKIIIIALIMLIPVYIYQPTAQANNAAQGVIQADDILVMDFMVKNRLLELPTAE